MQLTFSAIGVVVVVAAVAFSSPHIVIFQPEFAALVDANTTIATIASRDYAFAHEAGVYLEHLNRIVFVSNVLEDNNGKAFVEINAIDLNSLNVTTLDVKSIVLANGAAKTGATTVALVSQGAGAVAGGVVSLDVATHETNAIVDDWHGLPFNSPNDIIAVGPGRYLWTDPPYAFAQGLRTGPQRLAPYVWYHDARAGITQPVLDGFIKPNGLCLSPDGAVLYVSDTGYETGRGTMDVDAPRSVYAFDFAMPAEAAIPIIRNRRLFAVVDEGVPDGLKVDRKGNLYAGVGSGVDVFNRHGVLIGKILTPNGMAVGNLVFVRDTLYFFAETHLFSVKLKVEGHPV